jgi:two-component system, sensor histidine kinase
MTSKKTSLAEFVLDRTPEQVFWSDTSGRLIYVNQAASLNLGYPREVLLTIGVSDIWPDLNQHTWPKHWEALKKQGHMRFEARQVRQDGGLLEVEIAAILIAFDEEEFACCHVRDISGLKAALRDKDQLLRVEEELRLARDAAEAANRGKSEFLAKLSHEIRTSMNGVIGMTELLRTTPVDDQQQEYLDILQASADGLLFLINDMLDLSRIEAGKLSLCRTNVELGKILQEIAESQRYMLGMKHLQLQLDLDSALPDQLVSDAQRLKQILLNLLVNAIKFTEHGQISIRTRVLERSGQNVLVRISIADTGIGMSKETLQRIFKPFEQADAETTSHFGGSGLGLAICKQLSELLGGGIEVESQLGQGSTFHVTLPFTIACATPDLLQGGDDHHRSSERLASCRILIAEDNEMIQGLLGTLLQHLGHQSVCCDNGQSAIEQVQNGDFDLVLMDIRMPVMGGLQALRHIRAWEKRTGRRQPVIAITAHAMHGDREKYLQAGFDGYLSKPLKMIEFTEVLQEVLAAKKTRGEMAAEGGSSLASMAP